MIIINISLVVISRFVFVVRSVLFVYINKDRPKQNIYIVSYFRLSLFGWSFSKSPRDKIAKHWGTQYNRIMFESMKTVYVSSEQENGLITEKFVQILRVLRACDSLVAPMTVLYFIGENKRCTRFLLCEGRKFEFREMSLQPTLNSQYGKNKRQGTAVALVTFNDIGENFFFFFSIIIMCQLRWL